MATLHTLPRDIISLILGWLEINDHLQLHCVGDSALAAVFQRTTLPPIRFVSVVNFLYGQLPAFVQNYGAQISHFELFTPHPLAELPAVTQRSLRYLSNVRTLVLHTTEAEQILVCVDKAELNALQQSYRGQFLQIGLEASPKMIDLHNIFPKLEKIDVKARYSVLNSVDFFVLRELPLTCLIWSHNTNIDDNILHFLPPTLKDLELNPLALNPAFPSLPPQLESLYWNYSNLRELPPRESIEKLPPSLTELRVVATPSVAFPCEYLEVLPPKLTSFRLIQALKLEQGAKIPPEINTLQLRLDVPSNDLLRSIIFPRTITRLYIGLLPADFDHSILPATLRYLQITGYARSTVSRQAPVLPLGLLEFNSNGVHSLGGQWPPRLERLEVQGATTDEKVTLTLPTTLLYLRCGNLRDRDIQALPDSLTQIHLVDLETTDSTIILKFPPRLTYLRAERINFTTEEINLLPKTLLSLIASNRWYGQHKLMLTECTWPPFLQELCLASYYLAFTLEFTSNLPRTLKVLQMQGDIPVECFPALPADLETLHLQKVTGDLDAHLRALPRRLKSLMISYAQISPKAAIYLPRTLTSLELELFKLNAPHLLPVGLRSLRAAPDESHGARDLLSGFKGPYDHKTRQLRTSDNVKYDASIAANDRKNGCVIS